MIDWNKPIQVVQNKAPARVLCTDLKSKKCPVVVAYQVEEGAEFVTTLTLEGYVYPTVGNPFVENVPQRHKHADVIIAWANGADVQVWRRAQKDRGNPTWVDDPAPMWLREYSYRVKPK